jgi:hypothetical protein
VMADRKRWRWWIFWGYYVPGLLAGWGLGMLTFLGLNGWRWPR